MRERIAIYIDFALRIPSFKKTYTQFKNSIFNNIEKEYDIDGEVSHEEIDEERPDENILPDIFRFFWSKELENPEIENFYLKKTVEKEDAELYNSDYKDFFYSEEHWKKFMEDFSFNLYAGEAEVPFKKDIDLLNITQTYLFDVILVDEFYTTRKKSNTFFYLSKIRITPQGVVFLGPGQEINEKNYFGVWNPKKYPEHINKDGYGEFEIWLKELEKKVKEKNIIHE